MTSVALLPSLGPFGRVIDMRVWPHGFTTRQTDTAAGPAGSAIVRPNLEDAAWHAATAQKWGGNIVWTGSTPRHTIAYNGPRGRYWGAVKVQVAGPATIRPWRTWFAHNGAKVDAPSGQTVLGAALRVYDDLPTHLTYAGTGNGTLTVQSPSTAVGALTGDYTIRCIEVGATPRFLVTGPDAQPVGVAEAGAFTGAPVLFDSVVRFTLQSGAAAFVVGDAWTLTVEEPEQFIILTQNIGGPTTGPDTSTNDRLWRRGVHDLLPWHNLADFAPGADEYFPVPQPWFINASCTQAVTMRSVEPTGGAVTQRSVTIDLATLTRSAVDEGTRQFTGSWDVTVDTLPVPLPGTGDYTHYVSDEIYTAASRTAPRFMDWIGDDPILGQEETSFARSWHQDNDGNVVNAVGSMTVQSDLIVRRAGLEIWRRTVVEDGRSATVTAGTVSAAGMTLVHRPVHSLSIGDSGVVEAFASVGQWIYTLAAAGIYDTAEDLRVHHKGAEIAARTGGGTYYESGDADHPQSAFIAVGGPSSTFPSSTFDESFSQPLETPEAPGGPFSKVGTGPLLSILNYPLAYVADGLLGFVNNRMPAEIGSTWAADMRSNLLSVVEIPIIGGNYQPNPYFPVSDFSIDHLGVECTGSGAYDIATGGPDGLTESLVHSLTGYAPDDIWQIGAF